MESSAKISSNLILLADANCLYDNERIKKQLLAIAFELHGALSRTGLCNTSGT